MGGARHMIEDKSMFSEVMNKGRRHVTYKDNEKGKVIEKGEIGTLLF